jgi:hypothetical protein
MNSSISRTHRFASALRWLGLLAGGAIVCMIALSTHVYVMSALNVSAHLLSIRLERATGCDAHQRVMSGAGQVAQSAVEAYLHVCIETRGSTTRGGYLLMLDLE